jgi:hypothetical protein
VVDGIAFEESAWPKVSAFVSATMEQTLERGRQILPIDEYENAGTRGLDDPVPARADAPQLHLS